MNNPSPSFRTPLAKARGLGSAKQGTHHWYAERLSALALVPLTLWAAFALAGGAGDSQAEILDWVANPIVTVGLVLLFAITFQHLSLGLQVVIEDYVPAEPIKIFLVIAVKFGCAVLALIGIVAVLTITLGGN